MRDGRQNQKLAAHLLLMHEALEDEHALAMEGENPRSFFERRELLIHHDVEVGIKQRKIVFVVGLQIPEFDLRRLVAMNGDEFGAERIDFAELGDGCFRAVLFTATASVRTGMPAAASPG